MKETDVETILDHLYVADSELVQAEEYLDKNSHVCPRCHTIRYANWPDRINARSLDAARTKVHSVIDSISDHDDNQA